MAYTEFYVQTTGDNLNAGSTTADSAVYTGVGDSDGTNIFTPSDGSTPANTVSVGDFASVYVTAGATIATFIGRVTAVAAGVNGTITVSTTAKVGTFPSASAGAHTITCKTGGAWKGPNAAVAFPFAFLASTLTNASGDYPRANFKSGTSYSISTGITHNTNGPAVYQGYTSSAGDGGQCTIDGSTNAIVLMTVSGTNNTLADMIFTSSATTGTNNGVTVSGAENIVWRCVATGVRGAGYRSDGEVQFIECEAYACNKSNLSGVGGFVLVANNSRCVRCISHDNTGSNSVGFGVSIGSCHECIADTNTNDGFQITATTSTIIKNCDSYNNGGDGFDFTSASAMAIFMENCNAVKNGGWGLTSSGASIRNGIIFNTGLGAGTQVNGSGGINTNFGSVLVTGTVTYANDVTPWNDPANGDFKITLTAAKGAGRGSFLETASSYAGTTGYPCIGAAQANAAAAVAGGSFAFIG